MTVLINGTTGITTPGLTNEGSQTISTGTANGVTYLNGSKVLTSGSALVFDGTNLGVGTSTPDAKLSVSGASSFTDGVNSTRITFGGGANKTIFGPTTANALQLVTNNISRAEIDVVGNLGLGVTPNLWDSAWRNIDVLSYGAVSSSPTAFRLTANSFNNGANWIYKNTGQASYYQQSTGSHYWVTAPSGTAGAVITFTETMTLDATSLDVVADGSFTTSGANSADIAFAQNMKGITVRGQRSVNTGGFSSVNFSGSGYSGSIANVVGVTTTMGTSYANSSGVMLFATKNTTDSIPVERARIDSSGNFSLASGTFSAIGVYNNTTASAANLHVSSAGGLFFRSTSALKYKQDIRDLESMDIGLLRPVRYKSKCEGDDQTKDHLGLIADEAAGAGFEELVTRGADGEVEGFQYERLTVVLLKELQTLRARVTALEGN